MAAVAAGLSLVETDLVVVLAGDMPFAADTAGTLATALRDDSTTDAVVGVDAGGRPNPLLAAYRTASVREALPDPPADAPARSLLALAHTTVAVDDADALDVDTPEALAAARHRLAT